MKKYGTKNLLIEQQADARKVMKTDVFLKEKEAKMARRRIRINWNQPEREVLAQLTQALIKTGTNKYIADQVAKEMYAVKTGKKVIVFGKEKKSGSEEMERARMLNKVKKKLESDLRSSLRNHVIGKKLDIDGLLQLVKLSYPFKHAVRALNFNEREVMAYEMALSLKEMETSHRRMFRSSKNIEPKRVLKELDFIDLRVRTSGEIMRTFDKHKSTLLNEKHCLEKVRNTIVFRRATKNMEFEQKRRFENEIVKDVMNREKIRKNERPREYR
jgi:hypothetical protein